MTDTIKVLRAEVRAVVDASFPAYRGRSFRVVPSGRVTFADLHWDGGTRSEYKAVRLAGGRAAELSIGLPWASPTEGRTVDIPPGFVVVEHSQFCGKDCGINIYCHPGDVGAMLPAHEQPIAPCSFDESSHYRAEG